MLIKVLSYVPAIIGLLTIGLFILLNNAKKIKNRAFVALNLFIALWLFSLFIADISTNLTVALWAFRAGLFFGEIMLLCFFYFSLVFPVKSKVSYRSAVIYSVPIIITSVLLLTPLGVSSVSIQGFGVQPETIGFVYTFSDLLGLLYLLIGILILLIKYRHSEIQEKNQIKFILFGLSLAIIVNVFTGLVLTLLKVDTNAILFGSFSLFVFSAFVAFTIVKHGFLDVRLIVARTIGYVFTIATIAGIYSVILFGLLARFVGVDQVSTAQQLLYIVLAVFLAFTFQPIKRFFDKLSNKLFYRDAYEPQVLLNQLSSLLVSSIDLDKILHESANIIQHHLKAEHVIFHINKSKGSDHQAVGKSLTEVESLDKKFSELIKNIHGKIIVPQDLTEHDSRLVTELSKLNIAVVARMISLTQRNTTIGYLILGSKKSGNLYNQQDLRIINIIADELALAIENALRFEEIQKFNITLQQKVDDATRQLRRTNEKLKALDETKDEFISMASHQLRTPLTSVKGYVSMVLEGDAGKINDMQRKLLDQAFVSSQRMVYLIADLLNVSRLRTGKFVIEPKPTNLADVVEGELSQLIETAKSRNLELTFKKPDHFPLLMLDETKTRQVVMNFVDNAIYYTPSGGHIQVNLVENGDMVEFTVVDDGLGVPKADQHHLFTKFYRAGNAKKARPDGTGLGLFMAKKVIVAQGGAIIFRSQEGKGSTFGFSFSKSKLKVPEHLKAAPAKSRQLSEIS